MKKENNKDNPAMDSSSDDSNNELFGSKFTRRTFLKGSAAISAGAVAPMYLEGISKSFAAKGGPVKIGHIEDLSGNLAVYGVQKDHAAQLAVKEINEGKTLKGGPVGSGGLGAKANYATNPPIMGHGKGDLKVVDDGGKRSGEGMAFVEDDDALVDSGDSGILGKEVELIHPDGQSNNNIWQQHFCLYEQNQLPAAFLEADDDAGRG